MSVQHVVQSILNKQNTTGNEIPLSLSLYGPIYWVIHGGGDRNLGPLGVICSFGFKRPPESQFFSMLEPQVGTLVSFLSLIRTVTPWAKTLSSCAIEETVIGRSWLNREEELMVQSDRGVGRRGGQQPYAPPGMISQPASERFLPPPRLLPRHAMTSSCVDPQYVTTLWPWVGPIGLRVVGRLAASGRHARNTCTAAAARCMPEEMKYSKLEMMSSQLPWNWKLCQRRSLVHMDGRVSLDSGWRQSWSLSGAEKVIMKVLVVAALHEVGMSGTYGFEADKFKVIVMDDELCVVADANALVSMDTAKDGRVLSVTWRGEKRFRNFAANIEGEALHVYMYDEERRFRRPDEGSETT